MFSGAPRKKSSAKQQAVADLLVFGYACKVFRDDEKALYHEQGKHLIPWMGDPHILIDRYDGRGHLHDLSEYDAEHNSWNRNYNLSEEEARIEALCDEERYLALHTDLLEEEARQEEEYKRLSEALAEDGTYNTVGFKYQSDYYDPSQPTEEEEPQKDEKDSSDLEDNEEPFIAPEGLNVPSDVELPATAKMHAIIERTASFVCKQGAQFEIMLKAKQARNSQFDFLRFDHYLNPYYRHILRAMKEGRYTMLAEKQNEKQKKNDDDEEDDDDDDEGSDYLHPSLFASKRCSRLEELTRPLKVIDPDHPLAALVRKAKNEKMASQLAANVAPAPAPDTQTETTTETTVTSTYYNYYMLPDGTYCLAPPPPAVDASASYSSITAGENTESTKESAIPAPQTTILPSLNSVDSSNRLTAGLGATSTLAPVVAIIPPPPDIQPVIDKLAQYVARNGIKFETSVRAKNDSRFEFLQPWHQYNPYYEFKKHFFMQKEGIIPQPYTTPDENSISTESLNDPVMHSVTVDDGSNTEGASGALSANVDASSSSKPVCDGKLKVSFAPISFAIKMKETDFLPLEKNRVKLDDDSEEEDGDGKDGQQTKTSSSSSNSQTLNTATIVAEEKKPQLTPEELEAKQAKQKLEDRLAAAAREKLAQAAKESKEKQLQAERKRKAALFLQTLKNPLEMESGRQEENNYGQEVGNMDYDLLPEDIIVPTTEYPMTARSPIQEYSRVEREKKKKKRKKRSRSRSHSPKIHYNSKSRSHSKVKHSLPTAYRTVRRSRSHSRSPRKVSQSSERRREDDRAVTCSYRAGYTPGNSKKRSRSRSPHDNRKKRHSRSESKTKVRSFSRSPSRQGAHSSTHSTSISPVESRGSSQERYRGNSQDKDGHIASEIVSSVQTKITQDLMAKVRAMLAASKKMHSSAS
ncbi:PREDICTED: splicing factor, suppressor of white-apricot homolog isoform X2 [Nanorana parkeri]|uniref:splicing factor, suppressor of white-apricot homolog isoform X2 n=1 Tax=Nanorana parkeri TaxID=125878 RepID=UPI000853FDF1|nr:PREDICTED: splicing factor, suppressor of white-apricot homolog isoform X2 [Nanorana parkeri]